MSSHRQCAPWRLTGLALGLAGLLGQMPLPVSAQTSPSETTDWAAANRRVGELLRGHIDIVQWETANPKAPLVTPPVSAGPPLTLEAALRAARPARPDLIATPGMARPERARLQQAAAVWTHTVSQAWMEAVAAREALHHLAPVVNATQAATELARRMAAVGNWSAARAASEELVWLTVQNQWTAATQRAHAAEQRLLQHLPKHEPPARSNGLPHRLPPLPQPPASTTDGGLSPGDIDAALQAHPDWSLAETEAQRLEAALPAHAPALIAQTMAQWWDTAGPDGLAERPFGTPWPHDWTKAVEARAKADALARQVRADLALAHRARVDAHALAARAEQALNLSQQLLDDMQQRYNGMLHSTWDLVAAGRQRAQAAQALTEARLAVWRAHTAWQAVLAGLPYSGGPTVAEAATPAAPKGH